MKTYTILFFSLGLLCGISAFAQEAEKTANDAALAFYNKGEALRKARQYDKAIVEYDYALAVSDTMSMVHFAKGISYMSMKDMEKAIESLEKSVAINKGMISAYQALIQVYTVNKDEDKMLNTLERMAVAEKDPLKKLDAKLKIAQIFIRKKDYKGAQPHVAAALTLDKTNLDALYYDASINNALGNYDAARKSMESATSTLSSNDPKVTAKFYYELGYAYHKLKQYPKSEAAFANANFGPYKNMIAKLTPDYYYSLATSYVKIYDYPTAVSMLNMAIEINKDFASAYQLLAEITIKNENYPAKTIDFYKKAAKGQTDPKEIVRVYDALIDLLLSSGKYAEAVTLADECLVKAMNARNILFMKSMALYKLNKVKESVLIAEQLVKDANISPLESVMYNLAAGMMQANLKQYPKAAVYLEAARKGPFTTVASYEFENIQEFLDVPAAPAEN